MALTESNMLPLGTKAPNFSLPDTVSGNVKDLNEIASKASATVIMFWCNHCPYVIHVQAQIVRLAKEYATKNVAFAAISSNDAENYPDDSPEKMKSHARQFSYPFPYLYDETQAVARAYDAACTPDFYVFDKNLRLAYRGRLDASRPKSGVFVTGIDLRNALEAVLADESAAEIQHPSMGCSIKWKKLP